MTRKSRKGGFSRKQRGNPSQPGPAICSPIASTRRYGRTCLPSNVRRRLGGGTKGKCKNTDGVCLVEQSSLPDHEKTALFIKYFRPKQPDEWKTNPYTWLTSDDIGPAMNQFEEACPHFKFIGVVPIDFSAPDPYAQGQRKCMNPEFCHVDLEEERKAGKTLLGAVFNLDPHYKGGSHWVALAIDLKRNKAYYFDSYGMNPPEQVARYMRYLTTMEPNLVLESNGRQFQKSDTECGMYAMYFLYCMMSGSSFKKFCKHPIPDKWMYKFRSIFFRPA